MARLLVPEPPELERGGKRPRPGRGPDIGTVGLDAISGSICYAAAPPEATAAAYCMDVMVNWLGIRGFEYDL